MHSGHADDQPTQGLMQSVFPSNKWEAQKKSRCLCCVCGRLSDKPELQSDGFKDRLRHPPVFKLPRVRIYYTF